MKRYSNFPDYLSRKRERERVLMNIEADHLRERERERERETDRQTDRQTDRDRGRQRERILMK